MTLKRAITVPALLACYLAFLLLSKLIGVYYLHVLDIALINIVLAVGLNFILGFGGQISMAQAAFFGIGAYTYSILVLHHFPGAVAAPAGVIVAALVGICLGWPALKLKGHYLALATLGFGVIMQELMTNLGITGGANGLTGIVPLSIGSYQLNTDGRMLVLLSAVVFLLAGLSYLFAKSPIGMKSRALRDDEIAAGMIGINVSILKIVLFTFSAVAAGLAGVLYASLLGYVSPDVFAWSTTFNYLVMVVIGGLGATAGPIIGAVLFTFIPEWLRFLRDYYMFVFGFVVIVMIAVAPDGLVGLANTVRMRCLRKLTGKMWPSGANTARKDKIHGYNSN